MDKQLKNEDDIEVEDHDSDDLPEVDDDELRSKLADDLGIDPDEQSDLLEKVVQREIEHRKKMSGAIKQKINWREKALQSSKSSVKAEAGNIPKKGDVDFDKLVDQKLTERLEERDLESLNLPDEIRDEVRDFARFKNISVREAAQHSYILNRKEEHERSQRIKAATPKRSNSGSYTPSVDPSKPLNPSEFVMNSEEGVKAWKSAREARKKYLANK